jgi:hypothetical protein
MRFWLIIDENDRYRQVQTDTETPVEAGEDVAGKTVIEMDRFGDLSFEIPNLTLGVWEASVPLLADRLIAAIEEDREKVQMAYLTPGLAKTFIYGQKALEVERFQTNPSGSFPAAEAEAALTGETVDMVIARFAAGIAASETVLAIEARAQHAKALIRSAATANEALIASEVYWQP